MSYDGKLLAQARDRLDAIRAHNQSEHQRRIDEVYTKLPAVAACDNSMRRQMGQLLRLMVSGAPDLDTQLEALKQSNLKLQMHRAELLVEGGYPMEYLDELYSCEKCNDTGIYTAACAIVSSACTTRN